MTHIVVIKMSSVAALERREALSNLPDHMSSDKISGVRSRATEARRGVGTIDRHGAIESAAESEKSGWYP
ncbi:hypothetical protein L596_004524 [Steinernema carpocapsae]|uniref:Uncharacterized protein n=1 Tax=Steinernema carpocapsae TaxID=34508 RepID=A0A4U8UW15_STECR|nr:hypothetical protein L596_004524 [Steinernema carpocapsae]